MRESSDGALWRGARYWAGVGAVAAGALAGVTGCVGGDVPVAGQAPSASVPETTATVAPTTTPTIAPTATNPGLIGITKEEADRIGYGDGDATVGFSGPSFFGAGRTDQVVLVGISSIGRVDGNYTVIFVQDDVVLAETTLMIPALSSVEVPLTFDARALARGESEYEVALWSDVHGSVVDTTSVTLNGLDLDDPAVRADLVSAIPLAKVHPEAPSPAVQAVVEAMIADPPTPSPEPSPSPS